MTLLRTFCGIYSFCYTNRVRTSFLKNPCLLNSIRALTGDVKKKLRDQKLTVPHPRTIRDRMLASEVRKTNSKVLYYLSVGFVMLGLSFLASPFYKIFCQATGMGGDPTITRALNSDRIETMQRVGDRKITIHFNADVSQRLQWQFQPEQNSIQVVPGETALAFYVARNLSERPIIGISTYNIVPFFAARYFNKIQCFCFEEQRLNPNEEVDMPVFFYIDPDFAADPLLTFTDDVTLSYTFFEAKGELPLPGFAKHTLPPPPTEREPAK